MRTTQEPPRHACAHHDILTPYRCSRCGQPKKRHQCTAPPPDPEEEALLVAAKAGAKGKMERERGLGLEADGNAVGNGNEGRYGWTRRGIRRIMRRRRV